MEIWHRIILEILKGMEHALRGFDYVNSATDHDNKIWIFIKAALHEGSIKIVQYSSDYGGDK